MAKLIHRLSGTTRPLKLEFTPYDEISAGRKYEDVRRRVPDVTNAEGKLGFQTRVNLEEGLKITIEWQKAIRAAEHALSTAKP